jgi:hypothetical protein
MKFEVNRSLVVVMLFASAGMLGGCLGSEESDEASFIPPGPDGNAMPTISGSPGNAIMVGDIYEFTPLANDDDGDALTFSIENLPTWATFSASTGAMSGQTFLGDEGFYDEIVLSVSDGTNKSSLPAFSVTVTQGALGSMTLSWTAPSENTDGTALTDLAGYRIYYGRSEGIYPNSVVIDNIGLATVVVDNLLPGTYFVVSTAINAQGYESTYSNIVERVVDGS